MTQNYSGRFLVPAMWFADEEMVRLTPTQQTYFLRILGFCRHFDTAGEILYRQLPMLSEGIPRPRIMMRSLCDKEVIDFDPERDSYKVRNASKWLPDYPRSVQTRNGGHDARHDGGHNARRNGGRNAGHNDRHNESVTDPQQAAQRTLPGQHPGIASSSAEVSRAPAYKESKKVNKEGESVRSSGTERTDSPSRAVTRRGDAASRPAPEKWAGPPVPADQAGDSLGEIPKEFAHLSGPALSRAILEKGKENSAIRTGRDTTIRKYEWSPTKVVTESVDDYWDRRDREAGIS